MAETVAETAVAEGHHAELTLFGLGAEAWVYTSVAIFLVLAVVLAKLPSRITGALDERIAAVKKQLAEAADLRAEAEALLADANRARAAAEADAAAIRARAEAEASQLVAGAETAAAETIARRTAAATAKIAAAERAASAELRAEVANQVLAAASRLIAERADAGVQARLTDDAIAGLERKLH
jgi:F-type H+-transporting ATPase subunit b